MGSSGEGPTLYEERSEKEGRPCLGMGTRNRDGGEVLWRTTRLFFYAKNNANLLIPLHDNFGLV